MRTLSTAEIKPEISLPNEQGLTGQREDAEEEEEEDKETNLLPTLDEVRRIMRKNNKAPGSDNITSEMIKHDSEKLLEEIHKLILCCHMGE